VTSQMLESANTLLRDGAYDLWGLKKNKKELGEFLSLYGGCVHTLPTHIYAQTPCKSKFLHNRCPLKVV